MPSGNLQTHPWILLKHDLIHNFLQNLLHFEPAFTRQFEEREILLQKPRSIGSEEYQSLCAWLLLQCLLHAQHKFCVLGMVEQQISKNQQIPPCFSFTFWKICSQSLCRRSPYEACCMAFPWLGKECTILVKIVDEIPVRVVCYQNGGCSVACAYETWKTGSCAEFEYRLVL